MTIYGIMYITVTNLSNLAIKLAKRILLIALFVLAFVFTYAQSLRIIPYYGRKFFHSGKNNIAEGNFDQTFSNQVKSSRYLLGIGLGYKFGKTNGVELLYTSQQNINRFYSNYAPVGSIEYITLTSYPQIQAIYNKMFNLNLKIANNISLVPASSIGLGVGFVKDPSKFGDNKYQDIIYGPNGDNLEVTINSYRKNSLNYTAICRLGIVLKHKNKEILRVFAGYMLGLNKPVYSNISYLQGSAKYGGSTTNNGSNFNLSVSYPFVLFKNQK